MDQLGKLSVEESNIVSSLENEMTMADPVVEYEIVDPIPELGQFDPLDEYFWMQQAVENNLENNAVMLNYMILTSHIGMRWSRGRPRSLHSGPIRCGTA
jgi:hypothetical protein